MGTPSQSYVKAMQQLLDKISPLTNFIPSRINVRRSKIDDYNECIKGELMSEEMSMSASLFLYLVKAFRFLFQGQVADWMSYHEVWRINIYRVNYQFSV